MSLRSLLRARCTIQAPTRTPASGRAGHVETWTAVYRNIRCRVQAMSADEADRWGMDAGMRSYKVYVEPAGRAFTRKQRVLFNGRTFKIRGYRDTDELGRLGVLACEEDLNE